MHSQLTPGTLSLSVALSGGGLTIGDTFLALPAIMTGDLIVPFPARVLSTQCYMLLTEQGRNPSATAHKFISWLKSGIDAYRTSVLAELGRRNIRVITREHSAPAERT